MSTLNMALKTRWYNEIKSGKKKTEYRDMTDYWVGKLLDVSKYGNKSMEEIKSGLSRGKLPIHAKEWTHIRFHNVGRSILVEVKGIKVEEGHRMFAISLGKVLSEIGS